MGDRLLESRKKTATCPSRSTGNQRVTTPPPPPPRRKPKPVVYVYWSRLVEPGVTAGNPRLRRITQQDGNLLRPMAFWSSGQQRPQGPWEMGRPCGDLAAV
ncbi:hypothetical protein TESG_06159 [Trichophyton tonsurans CBS 112818]|uniref:Uncharacterized protein n=1 Tax=Trichophyton tonsurans (strain CBS 112818) TaxID=647933 RepID=F2S530_TRIT1|nr:hypothetical protein TESG_06159 [Trichophyton tonsurans CBS 112818]